MTKSSDEKEAKKLTDAITNEILYGPIINASDKIVPLMEKLKKYRGKVDISEAWQQSMLDIVCKKMNR